LSRALTLKPESKVTLFLKQRRWFWFIQLEDIGLGLAALAFMEIAIGFNGDLIQIGSLNLRYTIIILNIAFFIASVFFRGKLHTRVSWIEISILLMVMYGVIWTVLGYSSSNNFYILEGKGYFTELFLLTIYLHFRNYQISQEKIIRILQTPLLVLFCLISITWLSAALIRFNLETVFAFLKQFTGTAFIGSENASGRIYFLNTVLLPLSAYIFCASSSRMDALRFYRWVGLYLLAMVAIGSRGVAAATAPLLLLCLVNRIVFSGTTRRFRFSTLTIGLCLLLLMPLAIGSLGSTRFFSNSSTKIFQTSDAIRYEQTQYLWNEHQRSPWIGFGFGHSVPNYARSPERPYSYEVFFVGLLMKTGYVGMFIYALSLLIIAAAPWLSRVKFPAYQKVIYLLTFLSTLFQASSNPFLDTPVGQLLLFAPWLVLESIGRDLQ
jgi:hypothetical protein